MTLSQKIEAQRGLDSYKAARALQADVVRQTLAQVSASGLRAELARRGLELAA